MKKTPRKLDQFVDKVLAFRPPAKARPVEKTPVKDAYALKKAAD